MDKINPNISQTAEMPTGETNQQNAENKDNQSQEKIVIPPKRDNRLFQCTAIWRKNGAYFKREMLICTHDRNSAKGMAQNHLPIDITQDPAVTELNIRVNDRGVPKNGMTYFVSEIEKTTRKDPDEISPIERALSQFSIIWGNEIGWRACSDYQSDVDRLQLARMNEVQDVEQMLYDWAKEFTDYTSSNINEYVCEKLGDLFGSKVPSIAELRPRNQVNLKLKTQAERDMMIKKAEDRAKALREAAEAERDAIIEEAKAEAERLLTEAHEKADDLSDKANSLITQRLAQMNSYIENAQSVWDQANQPRRNPGRSRPMPPRVTTTDKIVNGRKRRVFDIGTNTPNEKKHEEIPAEIEEAMMNLMNSAAKEPDEELDAAVNEEIIDETQTAEPEQQPEITANDETVPEEPSETPKEAPEELPKEPDEQPNTDVETSSESHSEASENAQASEEALKETEDPKDDPEGKANEEPDEKTETEETQEDAQYKNWIHRLKTIAVENVNNPGIDAFITTDYLINYLRKTPVINGEDSIECFKKICRRNRIDPKAAFSSKKTIVAIMTQMIPKGNHQNYMMGIAEEIKKNGPTAIIHAREKLKEIGQFTDEIAEAIANNGENDNG